MCPALFLNTYVSINTQRTLPNATMNIKHKQINHTVYQKPNKCHEKGNIKRDIRNWKGFRGRVGCGFNLNGQGILTEEWYLSNDLRVVRKFASGYLGGVYSMQREQLEQLLMIGTFLTHLRNFKEARRTPGAK